MTPPSDPPIQTTAPTLTTGKVILGVLVVISVILLFWLLYHFLTVVILIFTGIVISIAMAPAVDWLHQHKFPRSVSVILIYLGLVIVFIGFIFLVIPQTIQQVTTLMPRFEEAYAAIKTSIQSSSNPLIQPWVHNLPANLSSIFPPILPGAVKSDPFTWTVNLLQTILGSLFTLSAVLLLGFYWTLESERVQYAILLLLPVEKRDNTRTIIKDIESRVGGFVRGQGLLALAIGVMALVAYLIIGLPSVLSLAFLAGVFEMVPVFGPAMGALPALVVAFASNPPKILWVILATLIIQLLENHLLSPRIMQKTVGVNPIVTILSITGFGSLFGFPGLLMAIPLAAVCQVILDRALLRPEGSEIKAPVGRDRLSKLSYESQEFLQDVRKLIRKKETRIAVEEGEEIEDSIESIASELDAFLVQTNRGSSPS